MAQDFDTTDTTGPPRRRPLAASVLGAGWGFPVQRQASARLATAAEEESVKQAILIILRTAKGERVMRPDFGCGLHELVFAPNNQSTRAAAVFEVQEALRRWEPRIELMQVDAAAAGHSGEVLLVSIECRMRSTDNRFNLVYPFYLDRPLA